MPWIVQRTQGDMRAYLVVPDADASRAYFDPDRSKATEFHIHFVARGYCLDDTTTVVPIEDTKGES